LRGFALLRAREEGRKLALLKMMLRESVVYLSFLLLVSIINYTLFTGKAAYHITSDISRRYVSTPTSNNVTFSTINRFARFL
jgi:hypothetical protein